MEVCIRLQKAGKPTNKKNNYRVVVISRSQARQGRHLDILGYYDPASKAGTFSINQEKLDKWIKQGAQMSDTVRSLVKKSKAKAKK